MGSQTERWSGFPLMDLPKGIDEIILAKIQARDSYRNCRLVCRSWYDIISRLKIVHQQQQQLLIGSLISGICAKPAKELQIEITSSCEPEFKVKIKESGLARSHRIIASCNGLVLVSSRPYGRDGPRNLQIMNILTGDHVIIPAPPSNPHHRLKGCTMGLGFDPMTKTYKVVHLYVFSLGFEVLSVKWPPVQPEGEQWRTVPGPWLDDCNGKGIFQVLDNPEPVYTGRALHWSNGSDKYIVSMDVGDDQNPFRTEFPITGSDNYVIRRVNEDNEQSMFKKRCSFSLVEINGDLGFLHNVSDSRIDVWIMEDPRGRVWSKKRSIDSGTMNYLNPGRDPLPKLGQFGAVCSLGDGEVLVLKQHSSFQLYVYDSRYNVLQKIKGMNFRKEHFFIPHRTSFAALDTRS